MASNPEWRAAARQLRDMWEHKAWPDEPLVAGWTNAFSDWIEKFGFGRVSDAVQMASASRLRTASACLRTFRTFRDTPW
jgi:hypothetical protein